MAGELTNWTPGAPNATYPTKVYSYKGLIHFVDNAGITGSLQALADGLGNTVGIKISSTEMAIENPIAFTNLTASTFAYLNASKKLTSLANGVGVLTNDGSGNFTWGAGGGGITINSTAITSGTAGRILFENASNQVSEAAGLTYSSGLFTVLGTTQQAKFAYDASNHLGITVSSVGHAQLTLTGTSPTFRINNAVSINTSAQPTAVLDVKYTSGGIDTLKLTDTGNWIISFYQGATQRAGFDNYGRTWNTLGGNAIFNAGTGTIGFQQNSVTAFTSTGTGAVSGTLQLLTGFVGVGVAPTVKFHVLATTEQIRAAYDASKYASFTVGATGSLTIGLTGTAPRTTFSQGVTMGGTMRLAPYTVGTLPSGVVGDRAYVTDATAPTYLGALTGGGAVTCPVFYNGAAWVSC